jgi:hypothetical protein
MSAPETLTLRATAIAGQRYADDYAVMWRGMSNTIQDLPDDQLVEVARNDLQGSGPIVEAMRRLRVAIEKSNVESGIYSRRMFWLSIILGMVREALEIDQHLGSIVRQENSGCVRYGSWRRHLGGLRSLDHQFTSIGFWFFG